MNNRWFDVDKEGLGKLIEKHGTGRLIAELLQNALDENVTTVCKRYRKTVARVVGRVML